MVTIYNTLTRNKQEFKPLEAKKVGLYVCGITVYDYCHIGHARVFVAFDVIVRFFQALGYHVNYIRNITDIDDKIIKRAQENNESVFELTAKYIKYMHEDMAKLNILPPTQEPKATDNIKQIIEIIQKLIDNNTAYIGENGDVFCAVSKCQDYGKLSNKNIDDLQAGVRVDINDAKRSPLDFVLWKLSKENEPSWDSPWGAGRPGWHIECSAMSSSILGQPFDIHGGGADLIFPHHENEIAQSEAACEKQFVNYWMHVGFVQVNKEKMSKSLGNFFTIRDVLKIYSPEIVRYFLIASHYKSPVNYSKENLDLAQSALNTLYTALKDTSPEILDSAVLSKNDYGLKFFEAMQDDFNTPIALAVLFDLAKDLNILKSKDSDIKLINSQASILKSLANILGILALEPNEFLQGDIEDSSWIEKLITDRKLAREAKDFARADQIRKTLESKGVVLEDSASGTTWRKS